MYRFVPGWKVQGFSLTDRQVRRILDVCGAFLGTSKRSKTRRRTRLSGKNLFDCKKGKEENLSSFWKRDSKVSGTRMGVTDWSHFGLFREEDLETKCLFLASLYHKKTPRPQSRTTHLPSQKKNTKYPHLKRGLLWAWRFSCRKNQKIPGSRSHFQT